MEKLVQVNCDKAKTMLYAEDGVKFISKSVSSIDEFNEIMNKKVTLVDKGELLFKDMKKITFDGFTVDPHVGMKLGNSVSDITFTNESDKEEFIKYISEMKGWSKKETQLTPLNAAKWDLVGFILTPIFAYVMYGRTLEMEAGTFVSVEGNSRSDRKSRFFDSILETIGSTGVLIIAALVLLYFGYSIYKKYQNPPIVISYE
ncbi:MAG TPA: hypothetical protein PKD51_17725 [Saprospiraceae bacterium]|nr:hypothetical protein [Saprospiraceae bacterium]HMU02511.1 hypothetical protein [Saprospiraceae bacterium]